MQKNQTISGRKGRPQQRSNSEYEEFKFQQANALVNFLKTTTKKGGKGPLSPTRRFKQSRTFSRILAYHSSNNSQSKQSQQPYSTSKNSKKIMKQFSMLNQRSDTLEDDDSLDNEDDKDLVPDVFQLPLGHLPPIIDEILESKSPQEIRNLEKHIFRDDRSSLESLVPTEKPPTNESHVASQKNLLRGSFESQIPPDLIPKDEDADDANDIELVVFDHSNQVQIRDEQQQSETQQKTSYQFKPEENSSPMAVSKFAPKKNNKVLFSSQRSVRSSEKSDVQLLENIIKNDGDDLNDEGDCITQDHLLSSSIKSVTQIKELVEEHKNSKHQNSNQNNSNRTDNEELQQAKATIDIKVQKSKILEPDQKQIKLSLTNTTSSVESQGNEKEAEIEDDEKRLLNIMNTTIKRRISQPTRDNSAHRRTLSHTAESISAIFLRAPSERTKADYEEIHKFMKSNVKIFKDDHGATNFMSQATGEEEQKKKLTYEDCMKLYQVIMYKVFKQGENMCEYGAQGDRFFIILDGEVSVMQPREFHMEFNLMWDLYQFVIQVHEQVRTYRDDRSKAMGIMVSIIGAPLLRRLAFKHVRKLMEFLRKLEILSEELFEKYPNLDRRKINANPHRLKAIRQVLDQQLKQIDETTKGSISLAQPAEKKIRGRFFMMEKINTLYSGDSFGQDSLQSDLTTKRNATCQAQSEKVISAVLTKVDFQRVLNEYERKKTDEKINKIRQFDLFRTVTNKRLKNLYRFFYNPGNEEPYQALRNQYLFRQSDPVDGIYCILSGQVKQIKEAWNINEKEIIEAVRQGNSEGFHTLHTENSVENLKNTQLGIMNELRRNKAKQIVISILQQGEVLGGDEIINKQPRRKYSIQVCSEKCEYLYLSVKNFKEKFFNHSIVMKNILNGRVDQRQKFHGELETKKAEFEQANDHVQEEKLYKNLQEGSIQPLKFKKNNGVFSQQQLVKDNNFLNSCSQKVREIITKNFVSEKKSKKQSATQSGTQFSNKKSIRVVKCGKHRNLDDKSHFLQNEDVDDENQISPVAILDQKIMAETESKCPNIQKMVDMMKERRKEQAQAKETKKKEHQTKLKELSSNSQAGKIIEQNLCKRFNATHIEDASKYRDQSQLNSEKKMSIVKIQQKLVKDADDYYLRWKNERLYDEQVDLILQSLTSEKRIQREIKENYSDKTKLLHFIEFIKEKGPDFIKRLNIPVFPGNLLLSDNTQRADQQSRSRTMIDSRSNAGSTIRDRKIGISRTTVADKPNSVQMLSKHNTSESQQQQQQLQQTNCLMKKRSQRSHHVRHLASRSMSMSSGAEVPQEEQLDLLKVFFDFLEYSKNIKNKKSTLSRRKSAEIIAENTNQIQKRLTSCGDPVFGRYKSADVLEKIDIKQLKTFRVKKRESSLLHNDSISQYSKTSQQVFSPPAGIQATSVEDKFVTSFSSVEQQYQVPRPTYQIGQNQQLSSQFLKIGSSSTDDHNHLNQQDNDQKQLQVYQGQEGSSNLAPNQQFLRVVSFGGEHKQLQRSQSQNSARSHQSCLKDKLQLINQQNAIPEVQEIGKLESIGEQKLKHQNKESQKVLFDCNVVDETSDVAEGQQYQNIDINDIEGAHQNDELNEQNKITSPTMSGSILPLSSVRFPAGSQQMQSQQHSSTGLISPPRYHYGDVLLQPLQHAAAEVTVNRQYFNSNVHQQQHQQLLFVSGSACSMAGQVGGFSGVRKKRATLTQRQLSQQQQRKQKAFLLSNVAADKKKETEILSAPSVKEIGSIEQQDNQVSKITDDGEKNTLTNSRTDFVQISDNGSIGIQVKNKQEQLLNAYGVEIQQQQLLFENDKQAIYQTNIEIDADRKGGGAVYFGGDKATAAVPLISTLDFNTQVNRGTPSAVSSFNEAVAVTSMHEMKPTLLRPLSHRKIIQPDDFAAANVGNKGSMFSLRLSSNNTQQNNHSLQPKYTQETVAGKTPAGAKSRHSIVIMQQQMQNNKNTSSSTNKNAWVSPLMQRKQMERKRVGNTKDVAKHQQQSSPSHRHHIKDCVVPSLLYNRVNYSTAIKTAESQQQYQMLHLRKHSQPSGAGFAQNMNESNPRSSQQERLNYIQSVKRMVNKTNASKKPKITVGVQSTNPTSINESQQQPHASSSQLVTKLRNKENSGSNEVHSQKQLLNFTPITPVAFQPVLKNNYINKVRSQAFDSVENWQESHQRLQSHRNSEPVLSNESQYQHFKAKTTRAANQLLQNSNETGTCGIQQSGESPLAGNGFHEAAAHAKVFPPTARQSIQKVSTLKLQFKNTNIGDEETMSLQQNTHLGSKSKSTSSYIHKHLYTFGDGQNTNVQHKSSSKLTQNLFEVDQLAISAMARKQNVSKQSTTCNNKLGIVGVGGNYSTSFGPVSSTRKQKNNSHQLMIESKEYQRFTDKVIQTMQNRAKRIEQQNQASGGAQDLPISSDFNSNFKQVLINRPSLIGGEASTQKVGPKQPANGVGVKNKAPSTTSNRLLQPQAGRLYYGTHQQTYNNIGPNHYLRDHAVANNNVNGKMSPNGGRGSKTSQHQQNQPLAVKNNKQSSSMPGSRNENLSGNNLKSLKSSYLGSANKVLLPKQSWN